MNGPNFKRLPSCCQAVIRDKCHAEKMTLGEVLRSMPHLRCAEHTEAVA